MKLSIVASLYMSAPYIEEFCSRASKAARQLVGEDFEIVLVNDGSPDTSLDIAVALIDTCPQLKVVDLSRNFGHHKAMLTGLAHAQGERIFLLDVDLEEEPEWLLPFVEHMEQNTSDIVYGVQNKRKGDWFERWSGGLYYRLFNWLCDVKQPKNAVTARLMTRRFVTALLQHKEHTTIFSAICVITGFTQSSLSVHKHSTSPTTYIFRKKVAAVLNAVTSFSDVPLKIIFCVGFTIFLFSCCFAGWIFYKKLFSDYILDGWTSLMISVWILGGIMISFIGIIGLYLSKVFIETKNRPYTIIRKVYTADAIGEKSNLY